MSTTPRACWKLSWAFCRAAVASFAEAVAACLAFVWVTRAKNEAVTARQIAEERRQQTQRQLAAIYTEQGRQELLQGKRLRAAVYLSEAYQLGETGAILRFLLAQAMQAVDVQLATLEGHTDGVFSAAFSPDGHRVVTASTDKTAKVWDAARHQLLTTLEGHTGGVFDAAFSPDGSRVVTASEDGTAKVWNMPLENHSPVEITALVLCRVPWRLVQGQLLLATPDPTGCPR